MIDIYDWIIYRIYCHLLCNCCRNCQIYRWNNSLTIMACDIVCYLRNNSSCVWSLNYNNFVCHCSWYNLAVYYSNQCGCDHDRQKLHVSPVRVQLSSWSPLQPAHRSAPHVQAIRSLIGVWCGKVACLAAQKLTRKLRQRWTEAAPPQSESFDRKLERNLWENSISL